MHNWRPGEDITAARLRSGYASGSTSLDFSTGGTVLAADSPYDVNIRTASVGVVFPAGRFTDPPNVSVTAVSNSLNLLEVKAFNVSATGFTIYGERASSAATEVQWTAIEDSGS